MTRPNPLEALRKHSSSLGLLLVIGVMGYFVYSASEGDPEEVDPNSAAQQAEARAEAKYFRKRTRYWLEQIANQQGSFREAACEIECGGWWDTDTEMCRMQLQSDSTASRPDETRQVDQCV